MTIHGNHLSPPKKGMSLIVHGEGNKGHYPGPLDLRGQFLLVMRTGACYTSRQDLSPFSDEVFKYMRCLVIDGQRLLFAEPARLPLIVRLLFATCLSSWRSVLHVRLLPPPVLVLVLPRAAAQPSAQGPVLKRACRVSRLRIELHFHRSAGISRSRRSWIRGLPG